MDTHQVALLITHRVKPGREAEFRAWEHEIDRVVRTLPGFQGVEVIPPIPDVQEDWVIVLRFARRQDLDAWLGSPQRESLLEKGRDLCERPPSLVMMAAPKRAGEHPVAAVVHGRVTAGQEEEFRAWQERLEAEQRKFPGYLGREAFPPQEGVTEEWTIVFRFDSDAHLEAWLQSEPRARLLAEAEAQFKFDLKKVSSSFAGWFPGHGPVPPSWKQAMVVLLALYPVTMAINLIIAPHEAGWPLPVRNFLNNLIGTAILTWPTMRVLNRALAWWLHPTHPHETLRGAGLILLAYTLMLGLFLAI